MLLHSTENYGLSIELSSLHAQNKNNDLLYRAGTITYSEYTLERNRIIKSLENVFNKLDLVFEQSKPTSIVKVDSSQRNIKINFLRRKNGEKVVVFMNIDIPIKYLIRNLLELFREQSLLDLLNNHDNVRLILAKKVANGTIIELEESTSLSDNSIQENDELFLKFNVENEMYLAV